MVDEHGARVNALPEDRKAGGPRSFEDHHARQAAAPDYFARRRLYNGDILNALQLSELSLTWDIDLYNCRRCWATELQKSAPAKQRNIDRDVEVLSRLQLINHILPKEIKLLYITGDSHAFAAGNRIFPSNGGRSFSELYLRHPRAFLAESGVLSFDQSYETFEFGDLKLERTAPEFTEFTKWLLVLLAKFWKLNYTEIYMMIMSGKYLHGSINLGGAEIEQFCRDFPTVVSSFRESWDHFSHNIMLAHAQKMVESMPYMRGLQGLLKTSFAEVEEELFNLIDLSWRSTFDSATATSYGLTRISIERASDGDSKRILRRSIPLIYFESGSSWN